MTVARFPREVPDMPQPTSVYPCRRCGTPIRRIEIGELTPTLIVFVETTSLYVIDERGQVHVGYQPHDEAACARIEAVRRGDDE